MGIRRKIYRKVLTFLSDIGLRECDILPGHQRVRWTNAYGKRLYDDYVEHEFGALQALEDYLNRSVYYGSGSEGGYVRAVADSVRPLSPESSTQPSSSTSGDIADQVHESNAENAKFNPSETDVESGTNGLDTRMARHLFSIYEKGTYRVQLIQHPVGHIFNDRQLFQELQQSYRQNRGRLRSYCSLRKVCGIHFAKFQYGDQCIDPRCHNDICESGKRCHCIPPKEAITGEYDCELLREPPLSPPIGPKYLMDRFTNPGSINPNSHKLKVAWGIYFKEDWDWAKIWWILAAGFFPPSLLFGIMWGILKHDIQGAFGVACWWMTGATIVVGIVGTCTNA
ncbi:hypothetical protein GQX73_g3796 [Xylaria multiplex]|uniref:Uncharacterized protein n=1 Tax=Xylaria multiplex TaxID=323545 RepID=A0A7C8N990_9PEZI|nr:hypothetical protein GQX73_g3796 [Xylaria multiplex]